MLQESIERFQRDSKTNLDIGNMVLKKKVRPIKKYQVKGLKDSDN